jgi:membrane associated rhomboid family serine protease
LWVVRVIDVPAFVFILCFLAFDIGDLRAAAAGDRTNHVAHISGFVAGAVLALFFWPLLKRREPTPAEAWRERKMSRW